MRLTWSDPMRGSLLPKSVILRLVLFVGLVSIGLPLFDLSDLSGGDMVTGVWR